MIFDLSKSLVFMSASRRYPWSEKILKYFLPKQLMRRTANNAKLISELVDRRLKGLNEKQDFCSYILKYNDEKGMTVPEIKANASLFMAAGTDSSATILTGCIYFLSQHPDVLRRLTDEIRDTFKTQEDILFANTPTRQSSRTYKLSLTRPHGCIHRPWQGNLIECQKVEPTLADIGFLPESDFPLNRIQLLTHSGRRPNQSMGSLPVPPKFCRA